MRYGFVIDHHSCIGCHACTVACKSENQVPVGDFRTWVKYTEIGSFPAIRRHFAVLRCNHCSNAPCVKICPVNALEKRDDGIVDLDRDACIGCKACMQACPYDAIYLNDDSGAAEKCHYCAHRIEQELEPACVTVCPERAIIAGDLDDPKSEIAQLAGREEATVRRPEQGTGPNVFYLGADPVSLKPGTASEPSTYLWSERREPPPDYPEDTPLYPEARTVLDVNHRVHWGGKVSAYLVTKGIAAGAAMLAPFAWYLGADGYAFDWLPEILALLFTAITTVLLVADLKRPGKFLSLMLRPNTGSWLVKGAWVLMGFSTLCAAILACRWWGQDDLANSLRWPNLFLGAMAAGYTAFLFAQCEGRDLWQDTRMLLPHLLVQAIMLGSAALLPFVPTVGMAAILCASILVHMLFAVAETRRTHETDNARLAASLLTRIPAWPGSDVMGFRMSMQLNVLVVVVVLVVCLTGHFTAVVAVPLVCFTAFAAYRYEQVWLRAGQLPPLS